MKCAAKAGLVGVGAVALLALGVAQFIGSGVYNIGADDHHTKLVLAIIEELRERSITVRAAAVEIPPLEDAKLVQAGAERYARLCSGWHLAPGVTKSALRVGLYPHPPNLAQQDVRDARRAFWTVKHGIKMSGMPAWGSTLDDASIWELVAFVRQMPTMTAETYLKISAGHTG